MVVFVHGSTPAGRWAKPSPAVSTRILGISGYYHDAAAALLVDGEIVERLAGGALHPEEG